MYLKKLCYSFLLPALLLSAALPSQAQKTGVAQLLQEGKQLKDSTLSLNKQLDAAAKKISTNLFTAPELTIGQEAIYQNGRTDSAAWQAQLHLGLKFNAFGMPLNFRVSSGLLPSFGFNPGQQQLFNVKYAEQLQRYKNPAFYQQAAKMQVQTQLQGMKAQAREKIASELEAAVPLKAKLPAIDKNQVKKLISMSPSSINGQLDYLLNQAKQKAIQALPDTGNIEQQKDSITQEATALKQQLTGRINNIKTYFKNIGIKEERIKDVIAFTEDKLDEDQLLDMLMADHLAVSPLAGSAGQWYQKLQGFKLGSFSQQLPFNQLNQAQFLNGFQLALKTRKGPLQVGYAREENLVGLNETEFKQTIFSPSRYIGFFKAVVQQGNYSKGSISLAGTSTASTGQMSRQQASPAQQTYALGFEQSIKLPKTGEFRFELNKSFSSFRDAVITDFKGKYINDYSFDQVFVNDFNQSLGAGIYHHIEHEKAGINSDVYLNYSGLQFQNPGNSAFNQPRIRWGGKLKKTLFDNKLSFSVKADHRSNQYGTSGQGWKNQLIDLESRVKLGRKTALTLKYQDNASQSIASSVLQSQVNSSSKKYQVAGHTAFKLSSLSVNSQFSMALNQLLLPGMANGTSDNLMFTLFNTLVLGKQSFTASLFCNRDQSINPLIGNMLNADLAWQYGLAKSLFLSTGMTYLDNKQAARQVGGKQSLQFTGIKNADLSLFLDLRKNLVTPTIPALYSTSRGEISFTYHLRKN